MAIVFGRFGHIPWTRSNATIYNIYYLGFTDPATDLLKNHTNPNYPGLPLSTSRKSRCKPTKVICLLSQSPGNLQR